MIERFSCYNFISKCLIRRRCISFHNLVAVIALLVIVKYDYNDGLLLKFGVHSFALNAVSSQKSLTTTTLRKQQHKLFPLLLQSRQKYIPYSIQQSSTSRNNMRMLSMTLVPLSADEVSNLISATGKPTAQQYQSYFGRTTLERYNRILEGMIVALIGCSMSYFMSFVLGSFIATCLGTASLLWGILSPELKAYQRNWELLGGRPLIDYEYDDNYEYNVKQRGLTGAVWIGYVADVCVVEDTTDVDEYDIQEFNDYEMENDELEKFTGQPYLIRLLLKDGDINDASTSRELQIHARMSEEYVHIRTGMPTLTLLLCTDNEFTELAALTDVYVYDIATSRAVLVGDYPYLDRAGLEEFFLNSNYLWDTFINQKGLQKTSARKYKDKVYRNYDVEDNNYLEDEGYTSNSRVKKRKSTG